MATNSTAKHDVNITFQYNKLEHSYWYSPNNGRDVWFIEPDYRPDQFPRSKGDCYSVSVGQLNGNSYGSPMPIFTCRYLNEAKNFVRMCIHSQQKQYGAYKFKHMPGYGVSLIV